MSNLISVKELEGLGGTPAFPLAKIALLHQRVGYRMPTKRRMWNFPYLPCLSLLPLLLLLSAQACIYSISIAVGAESLLGVELPEVLR